MNILILNGGKSLRMGGNHKCLTIVNKKTIFQHELDWLNKYFIRYQLLVSLGRNKDLEPFFDKMKVKYICEKKQLFDGGAIKIAFNEFNKTGNREDPLFAINGDLIPLFNPCILIENGLKRLKNNKKLFGIIVIIPFQSHLGILKTEGNREFEKISSFNEKPIFSDLFSSCGIYLFSNKVRDVLPDVGGIASKVITKHYDRFETYKISSNEWVALETQKDILEAERLLLEKKGIN